jgi:hypothetical protein
VCAKLQIWLGQLTKCSILPVYPSAAVVKYKGKVCDISVATAFTGMYRHGQLEHLSLLVFSESQNDRHLAAKGCLGNSSHQLAVVVIGM